MKPVKLAVTDTGAEPRHPPVHYLGDFSVSPRVLLISLMAVVVGTAAVAAGVVLLKLIRLVTNFSYFGQFTLADQKLGTSPFGLWVVLIPVAGALIIGFMARYGSEKIRGHGIPEAIEAILLGRSRLDVRVAILKPLSSAIVIGTGGPFGAEGPIIMTGGAIGSLIAQLLPVSDSERKTLLVAGAAAGMTTVFGTPIAAIMLAVELLLFEWSPRSFVPVAVASILAAVERHALHMPSPLFPFTGTVDISLLALACWAFMGLMGGLLSGLLTQLVYACEDVFLKLPIHWMWWPAIGGLVVGLGGLLAPDALGVGYDNIAQMLQGHMLITAAVLLLVVKCVIWAVALGSGTSGGILAPLLIIGGAMGTLLAGYMPMGSTGFWALLAMAATMGGTMRSPLTATFFAAELTGNSHVLLPLIAACSTAHVVTVLLMRRSILTEKVARRGHHIIREYRIDPFALTKVEQVMTTKVDTVAAELTLHGAAALLTDPATRHPSFPVVDAAGRVLGVLDPPAVLRWRRRGIHRGTSIGSILGPTKVGPTKVPLAYPDEFLDSLADRMTTLNVAHMPVVSREGQKLVGYVGWKDLMRVRTRRQVEERQRITFFPMGRHPAAPVTAEAPGGNGDS